jgi:nucleotide-binding universal stress UspA family protein
MKIIVATEGSSNSQLAARALQSFRLGPTDSVHVVSIVDLGVPVSTDLYGGYLPSLPVTEAAATEAAEKLVSETVATIGQESEAVVTGEVLFGRAESRIVEAAADFAADMIIVGSHSSNALERILLGSVSDAVVHHAHCSVLIVRRNG